MSWASRRRRTGPGARKGWKEDIVRVNHVMANLLVADLESAKGFYTDYLGLSTEEFNMGLGGALHLPRHWGERPARHP